MVSGPFIPEHRECIQGRESLLLCAPLQGTLPQRQHTLNVSCYLAIAHAAFKKL